MSTVEIEGVDYSTDHPSAAGLAATGKRFACRYGGPGSTGKQLTPDEARDLTAHGVSIVAGAEGTEGGLTGGYNVGRSWATTAASHYAKCGMPPDRPIYFACDIDVTAAQWPAVRQALQGAAEVIGPERVGLYGGYNAISWAVRDGVARWFWQTFAWSHGKVHPRAHILQYRNGVSLVGGTVDLDKAFMSDYGQWTVGGTPPGGGDMELTPDQAQQVVDAAWSTLHTYGPDGQPTTALHVWTHQVNTALAEIDQQVRALVDKSAQGDDRAAELAALVAELRTLVAEVRDAPLVDPVAVAAAIAARPEIAATLAGMVARQLASIAGSITLSGSLSAGIVAPPE